MSTIIQRIAKCLVVVFAFGCSFGGASGAVAASVEGEGPSAGELPISLAPPFPSSSAPTAAQLEADAVSRTRYEHLSGPEAVALARGTFSIAKPVWQAPGAAGEGQIESYVNNLAAVEKTPGGGKVLVGSTVPLRVNNGTGLAPTSLALKGEGEAYEPSNPVVPVSISKFAAGGVTFPGGLAVTPVGEASGEAGTVVGNRVVDTNVAPDTDFMVEPAPDGAELSWQLRSQASPEDQRLLFHLPAGVSLRSSAGVPGGAEVVSEGRRLLLVPPAVALDAEGQGVPVSYGIEGSVLDVHVSLGGAVHFPVLVDPLIVGEYGTWGGANVWSNWTNNKTKEGCSPECFTFNESASLLQAGANVGAPARAVGSWGIAAPGYVGREGSAGITRVDLSGVIHSPRYESQLIATINESNGPSPVFSLNGTTGMTGYLPLYDQEEASNLSIAFCAQGDGGHDGGSPPLCDEENYQGHSFEIEDELIEAPDKSNYVQISGAKVTYRDTHYPNKAELKCSGNESEWVKTPGTCKISAEDEGLGIKQLQLEAPYGNEALFTENVGCSESNGFHGCPNTWESGTINLAGALEHRPSGKYELTPVAHDAVGNVTPSKTAVQLLYDHEGPAITLAGALAEASGGQVGEGSYALNFTAADGSPGTPQSGTKTLEASIDGRNVFSSTSSCAAPVGEPASNCFALAGSWTMGAQSYGVGTHKIVVTAKDWLGNESTKTLYITVNGSASEPLGPGSVNLTTGAYKLSSTDVSLSGGLASLEVSRSYDSRNLTKGAEGPLGPDWTLSLPDQSVGSWQSLTAQSGGSVLLTASDGAQAVFTVKEGGGFVSPAGYQNLTLTEPAKSEAFYELKDAAGDYAQFTPPGSGSVYLPTTVGQASAAGGLNKDTYSFTKTSEGIIEPTEVLAPEPSKGACSPTLVKGCRALTFNYATSTTATGGGPIQWGDYKGRLTRVYFTAWDPVKGEMSAPITVAQYAYDSKGRLRAEWDPRIEPTPLKVTYGYDTEGHVTSVAPPGQQPWLVHYGTAPGDPVTGRVLSVTRPAATTATKLKERGEKSAPVNTAGPTLSTSSPAIGTTMSVSSAGTWSNEPLAYAYQWQRCSSSGTECAVIEGATNSTYTPQPGDGGYILKAQVAATNIDGTTAASTTTTSVILMPAPTKASNFTSKGCSGTMNQPTGVTVGPSNEVWVAESGNLCVDDFEEEGLLTQKCHEGLSNPVAVAATVGREYVADYSSNRIAVFGRSCELLKTFGSGGSGPGQLSTPADVVVEPTTGNVWVADSGNKRVEEFSSEGSYITSFNHAGADTFATVYSIAFANGNLYIVDGGADNRVVIATPTGELIGQFGTAGSGNGQFNGPSQIYTDPLSGDLYVVDSYNNRVEQFSQNGTYLTQFGTSGSGENQLKTPIGVAANAHGELYVADWGNNRVQQWTPGYSTNNPAPAPPTASGESVWSVEYHVPLSGSGLPNLSTYLQLGQKDIPVEGTAVFPPDEPMGWPAASYKRASITYLDRLGRAVNTALPGGGISTTEYEEHDNTSSTLTADNRALALVRAEEHGNPHKGEERARQLETQYTYSSDGSELLSTLGPEHLVKIAATGKQVETRKQVRYFYDEEAPSEGGPYKLLTKTIEGEGESDARTITNFYGSNSPPMKTIGLGWTLHTPLSVSTSTGTQTLTSSRTLDASTGNVTSQSTPAATHGKLAPGVSVSQFGSAGSEPGQLKEPKATAITSSGNIDVADYGNSRISEFTAAGAYVGRFGDPGSGSGQLNDPYALAFDSKADTWVADTDNNNVLEYNSKHEYHLTIGSSGTGAGQFTEPHGIAIQASGTIFVDDTGNNRIEKFNESGVFLEMFGFGVADGQEKLETCKTSCRAGLAGAGSGELKEPRQIAITSSGYLLVADYGNNRIEEYTEAGAWVRTITGISAPKGVATDSAGDIYASSSSSNTITEFSPTGSQLWQAGTQGSGFGQFSEPAGLSVTAAGRIYIADAGNNRIDQWAVTNVGNVAAHTTQTIYYTAGTEASLAACQNHPEWAGLPCQEQPAAQPESGEPALPTTNYSYNIWNEPLKVEDIAGSNSRTTAIAYDGAGRIKTVSITSTTGTAISATTDAYGELSGALTVQSRTTEGVTKTLTSEYNTLLQLIGYTDADGNTTTYTYDEDGRPKTINDGKGTQTFAYDKTSGLPTSLQDSAAGTFTASYDAEQRLTSQGYPNGMTANYTTNPDGTTTALEYVKTTHCTSSCTWYKDSIVPSIYDQTLTQTSSLATENYSFDGAGRLIEAQETPAGKPCISRLYGFDEEGDRISTTLRESTNETCPTTGGTITPAAFDSADRLDEAGIAYDPFGDTTSLPASDAGGTALTAAFYANSRLASITQNGETISYQLDPDERPRDTISTGTTSSTIISHYASPSESPAWSEEPTTKHWTRYIPGLGGGLEAVQTSNGSTSIAIQLTNLHGDVIGTANDNSETETHLENTTEASEYGVPNTTSPKKYSWLGEDQKPTELSSGLIAMGARGYIPQIGRFLQPDPAPGGSDNTYGYTNQDPIDETDLTGNWTSTTSYNDEAAEPGQSSIPIENYIEAGALMPPPVNIQSEEALNAAHAALTAAAALARSQRLAVKSYNWTSLRQPQIFPSRAIGCTAFGPCPVSRSSPHGRGSSCREDSYMASLCPNEGGEEPRYDDPPFDPQPPGPHEVPGWDWAPEPLPVTG